VTASRPPTGTGSRGTGGRRTVDGITATRPRPDGRAGPLAEAVAVGLRLWEALRRAVSQAVARAGQVVTPLGWSVLVGAPAALAAGYALGWVELVAVGWAGIVVAGISLVYLLGRPRIEIGLELPHRRVVAGEPASGWIAGRNPHAARSLATPVEVPVGTGLAELVLPGLAGGEEHRLGFPLPTARRGVVAVGPVRTVRADPIGLVRRELVWAEQQELIVHPRIVAAPSTTTGLVHDLEGAATRDLSVSDLAFHALREYQPGDERRYIHWKSSAKTGTYMVRQFEQSRRSHLAVALSLAPEDYRLDEEFELAVSVTGSLGVRAIRDGRTVSVVVGAVSPGSALRRPLRGMRALATHRPERLLDELARVESSEGAPATRELAGSVADQLGHVSLAFLVCGSAVPGAQLRAAASAFPSEVRVIAVVCDPEARPGLRLVGGVDVLSVGLLDDLRQALARTAALS